MQSGFVNMQDRVKFETGRLHFGCHIAGMVLLVHLTNFSKFHEGLLSHRVYTTGNLCQAAECLTFSHMYKLC